MKILWMIPKWTLPAIDGARVATDSLIRNTINAGASVDVLCLSSASEKTDIPFMKKSWNVGEVTVLPRQIPDGGLAKKLYFLVNLLIRPFVPLTFSSFVGRKMEEEVQKIINDGDYDFVLLDGLHLGAPLIKITKKINPRTKIIYRAHNIETDLWKRSYEEKKNPILKGILYFQSLLVDKFERRIIEQSSGIAAIAQEDLDELIKIKPNSKIELIPLGLNFRQILPHCSDELTKFLFIGRLDWPPNRDGLEWLLKEVWPSVIQNRPDAVLKIVGSGNKDWLKAYQHLKGVQVVGFVDTLRDAYRDCHFTLVPIFYGSGTRIKVLESFAVGRKLISTKMGVQGAGLTNDDYLHAENKEEWIKILSTIKMNQTEQARLETSISRISSIYGEEQIGRRFYEWLKTLR
jgi:glycosyltransferase involved in cell wall biosynthesis